MRRLIFKMIKKVKKNWGTEEWIVNNKTYCGKILNLKKGTRGSIHYHNKKHETFYLFEGKVLLELGNELKKVIMKSGDVQTLEPGIKHRFTPLEDSKIIEFSTHHDDKDTYRESQSEEINIDQLDQDLE